MKRLRNKKRIDTLRTEERHRKGSVGRWIYLSLLLLLLLWLANTFVGKYLFLRAEGLLARDKHSVAVGYIADVVELKVEEGDTISQGQQIARVHSLDILRQLASTASRLAEIRTRRLELRKTMAVLDTLLPVAEKRAQEMIKLRSNEEEGIAVGVLNNRRLSELLQDEYESRLNYERMMVERRSVRSELYNIEDMYRNMTRTLNEIRAAYGDGIIRAPISGTVANLTVNSGSVVKGGEQMMDILNGEPYILAYITPGTLYSVRKGDPVNVHYGVQALSGSIVDIYPVSAELPKEFQRMFRPKERSRVVKIRLKDSLLPPTYTKVKVTSYGVLLRWMGELFFWG